MIELSVAALAALTTVVVAPSVVALAALTTAVVAPSVVVLAAVVPVASGRCPVPASDAAPHRLAPSSKVQGRGGAGVELAGMAAGRVVSGNAIGCSSSRPWLRRSSIDVQSTRRPATMSHDITVYSRVIVYRGVSFLSSQLSAQPTVVGTHSPEYPPKTIHACSYRCLALPVVALVNLFYYSVFACTNSMEWSTKH